LESQIEIQKSRFIQLHNQLGRLYEHLGKDHCLAYKNGNENINAFVIKQVRERIQISDLRGKRRN
jgi:hypothetical protein